MALVPMFTGYVLFGFGLSRIPVSTATTLPLLEPAVAAVFAVLVVGEHLPALGWTGVVLVIACLGVLTVPSRRRCLPAMSQEARTAPAGPGSRPPAHSGPPQSLPGDL
ncbi:DMT family transporter [Streptomyces atratus]|uniref:DMT family transporter n=1 Tax=Streptomyces atratus TaxID=1893 RepID=UPI0033E1C5CF